MVDAAVELVEHPGRAGSRRACPRSSRSGRSSRERLAPRFNALKAFDRFSGEYEQRRCTLERFRCPIPVDQAAHPLEFPVEPFGERRVTLGEFLREKAASRVFPRLSERLRDRQRAGPVRRVCRSKQPRTASPCRPPSPRPASVPLRAIHSLRQMRPLARSPRNASSADVGGETQGRCYSGVAAAILRRASLPTLAYGFGERHVENCCRSRRQRRRQRARPSAPSGSLAASINTASRAHRRDPLLLHFVQHLETRLHARFHGKLMQHAIAECVDRLHLEPTGGLKRLCEQPPRRFAHCRS